MLFKTRKPRGFTYKPRYSKNIDEDPDKTQFHFERSNFTGKSGRRSVLLMLLVVVTLVYLLIFFRRLAFQPEPHHFEVEKIIVE